MSEQRPLPSFEITTMDNKETVDFLITVPNEYAKQFGLTIAPFIELFCQKIVRIGEADV